MVILGLDLAKRSGFAIGPAGKRPESGSWLLRADGDDMHQEPAALARELTRIVQRERPDLIAVEEPMSAAAKWQKGYAQSASLQSQMMLHGALHAFAGMSRIRVARVASSRARLIVCGRSSAPKPPGVKPTAEQSRMATKRMVRDTLVMLGLLPAGATDLDRSDAVCVHAWASAEFGGARQALVLAS